MIQYFASIFLLENNHHPFKEKNEIDTILQVDLEKQGNKLNLMYNKEEYLYLRPK